MEQQNVIFLFISFRMVTKSSIQLVLPIMSDVMTLIDTVIPERDNALFHIHPQ